MKRLMICVAILALSALAHAETLTFLSTGSNTSVGVYTYPYYFSVNGSSRITPLMCLSYNNEITVGESWTVNVLPVTTILEREAAWLFSDAQSHSENDVSDNLAAWSLFASNVPMSIGADTQLSLAEEDYGNVNDADLSLYVPTAGFNTPSAPQTFIGVVSTPEPAYLWMTGIFFLMFPVGRKLWKSGRW